MAANPGEGLSKAPARAARMEADLWLVPLGVAAGLVGSVVGLGGGLIATPVLVSSGFAPAAAAAASLFVSLGNAAASTVSYWRQRRVRTSALVRLAAAAVPGTVLGALASGAVMPAAFKALLAVLLAACVIHMLVRRRATGGAARPATGMALLAAAASFFAGVLSSFFGIGGAGVLSHATLGHPDYWQALLLMSGAMAGGYAGARLSARAQEGRLRVLVAAVMGVAAAKLAADSVAEA
ncbi:MAG: sulfite exporter TauE/SafE family protein [Thaumarchaeota archaeon S15]|nr:MAG: sulfite exporter TauE/SafE family protein [Thaumarchaeota archaeon S15]